jgi:hypothetical protein
MRTVRHPVAMFVVAVLAVVANLGTGVLFCDRDLTL